MDIIIKIYILKNQISLKTLNENDIIDGSIREKKKSTFDSDQSIIRNILFFERLLKNAVYTFRPDYLENVFVYLKWSHKHFFFKPQRASIRIYSKRQIRHLNVQKTFSKHS